MAYGALDVAEVVQWSAGADWLTCTWADDSEDGAFRFARQVALDAAHETNRGSTTPEAAVLQGYKGMRAAGVFVGRMPGQGAILSASGAAARWLVEVGGLEPDNVSRLDVQVTIWATRDVGRLPEEVARRSIAGRLGAMGRPWRVQLVQGFGDGDTAYLGSRQSDVFCRCYDKGRESGEAQYNQAVRYEVEFKRAWAGRAYANLVGRQPGGSVAYDIVARTYERRGVPLTPLRPTDAPMVSIADDVADRVERRLNWYRTQVAPSIAELLTQGVRSATIVAALGL